MKSKDPSKDDVAFTRVTTGVVTAVATTTIIHTSKGVMVTLARHPLILFGLGISASYLRINTASKLC
jgi:sulfate adenylyltransferase subunit 1 (EFTu-like GTPase family)